MEFVSLIQILSLDVIFKKIKPNRSSLGLFFLLPFFMYHQAIEMNRECLLAVIRFVKYLLFLLSYPENIMPDTEGYEPKTMTIGTNNVFEVGCGKNLQFFFFLMLHYGKVYCFRINLTCFCCFFQSPKR